MWLFPAGYTACRMNNHIYYIGKHLICQSVFSHFPEFGIYIGVSPGLMVRFLHFQTRNVSAEPEPWFFVSNNSGLSQSTFLQQKTARMPTNPVEYRTMHHLQYLHSPLRRCTGRNAEYRWLNAIKKYDLITADRTKDEWQGH